MIVPLGAIGGFHLDHEIYVVAGVYQMKPRTLKYGDGRTSGQVALARDAMFWRLTVPRPPPASLSAARAAQMLVVGEQTVRDAVDRHASRIAEFNASIKERA